MFNILLYFCIIFGVFALFHGLIKTSIISDIALSVEPFVSDIKLSKKTQTISWLRLSKYILIAFNGFLLIIKSLVVLFERNVDVNILFFFIVVLSVIYSILIYVFTKKLGIEQEYNSIIEQWKKEKKVSNRHDDEVRFVRSVDDINNYTYLIVANVLIIFLFLVNYAI